MTKEERLKNYKEIVDFYECIGMKADTLNDLLASMDLEEWEIEILRTALEDNELDIPYGNTDYEEYNVSNKGCTMENPFVIREEMAYVRAEYLIVNYLNYCDPGNWRAMKLLKQSLVRKEDRAYDKLEWQVTDSDGNTTIEVYWFDITKGIQHIENLYGNEHSFSDENT